jgi:hypothetical protein
MYPEPPSPPAPKPRPNRLVAGLCWLVAGVAANAATLFDVYRGRSDEVERFVSLWRQWVMDGNLEMSGRQVWHGVNVLMGGAAVLVAGLLMFMSRQRWAGVVVGTFGTGMLVAFAVQWLIVVSSPPTSWAYTPRLGFWLLVAAAVVALVALVFSVAERVQPAWRVSYVQPQQPRWEPPTPRYGVPAHQPPVQQPRPAATPLETGASPQRPDEGLG